MTFKEMLTGLFNTDFLSEEELDTICKAAEMYADAKVKQKRQKPLQVRTPEGIMYLKEWGKYLVYCYDEQTGREIGFLPSQISNL